MEVWEIEVGRRERLARGTGGMSMVAMVYRCWKERATWGDRGTEAGWRLRWSILNSVRILERAAGDLQEPNGNRQFMALTRWMVRHKL